MQHRHMACMDWRGDLRILNACSPWRTLMSMGYPLTTWEWRR